MAGPVVSAGAAYRVRIDTVATRESVRFVSDLVQLYLTEALSLPAKEPGTSRIRLAIIEAVTNVVRHAYRDRQPGPMSLTLEREGEWLVAVLSDSAECFDPLAGEDRLRRELPRPEELRTGGYGLGIIGQVMDEVHHRYDDQVGNELTLKVRFAKNGHS
jgi:serine/threonine-protein kinase RsbW